MKAVLNNGFSLNRLWERQALPAATDLQRPHIPHSSPAAWRNGDTATNPIFLGANDLVFANRAAVGTDGSTSGWSNGHRDSRARPTTPFDPLRSRPSSRSSLLSGHMHLPSSCPLPHVTQPTSACSLQLAPAALAHPSTREEESGGKNPRPIGGPDCMLAPPREPSRTRLGTGSPRAPDRLRAPEAAPAPSRPRPPLRPRRRARRAGTGLNDGDRVGAG